MLYYSGIDYQTRGVIYDLEDKFADANSIAFLRDQRRETISPARRILSWCLLLAGFVLVPFCLDFSAAQFEPRVTYSLLTIAAMFIALFIHVDRTNLLIWLLGFLGAPVLLALSKVSFEPWVLLAVLLVQVGLLLSNLSMHYKAALHLLLLWEFCLGGFLLYLTQQGVFILPLLLALLSGFRVYGVAKSFRGLFAITLLIGLFALVAPLPLLQILLILATPVIFFVIF